MIHSLTRTGPQSLSVTAPGWVPASAVLESVTTEISTPTRDPGVTAHTTWSQWSAAHPVLVRGATVPVLPPATPTPPGHARIVVRSGPESGFAVALPQGEWTLGRGSGADVPLADPFLSRTPHLLVNSPAGIRIDGTAEDHAVVGSTTLLLPHHLTRRPLGQPSAAPASPEPHSSPDALTSHEPLDWPERPDVAPVRKPSWLVFAAPVVIGIVLALVVGTWWFLLLSAAGPLTAVLTLRGDRRRFARETVQVARDHRRAIDRTLRQLETRLHAFTADLDRIAYGGNSPAAGSPSGHSAPSGARSPAGSTGSLPGQSSRPTSGSAEDVPPGRDRVVVLGLGDVVSTASVHLPRDRSAREQARRRLPPPVVAGDRAVLIAHDAPLLVDRATTVRIDGPEAAVLSAVRSLVSAHLAAGSGCVAPARFPEFAGLSGLPHPCTVEVLEAQETGPANPERGAGAGAESPLSVLVHGPESTEHSPILTVTCGPLGQPAHIRVPSPDGPAAPGDTGLGAGGWSGRASFHPSFGRPLTGPAHVHSLSRASAIRMLASIAPRAGGAALSLPPASQVPTTGIADVLRLWETTGRHGHGPLVAPLGTPVDGPRTTASATTLPTTPMSAPTRASITAPAACSPTTAPPHDSLASRDLFLLDLRTSGPHALVAGTTGSGKSVLLETWLEALCRTHSPEDMRLVLLDFKGGASLSRFVRYPHTDCLLTDLDEAAALRALRSITAEVSRRELHLSRAKCRDIDELLDRSRTDPAVARLPRLLVVIDEFHVLTGLGPHVVAQFERLTAVGRSLGVHIVLATQRPSGVVSARMRANIALRICLRVRDDADSHEVLGIPDAAHLDPRIPGVALISDEEGIRAVRCAVPDDPAQSGDPATARGRLPHAVVRSLTDDAEVAVPLSCPSPPAARTWDGPQGPRHEVIAPPLPARLESAHLPGRIQRDPRDPGRNQQGPQDPGRDDGVCTDGDSHVGDRAVGLVDLPQQNRTALVELTAASGSVTVSGGRGRGWTTTVAAFAHAFAATGLPVIRVDSMRAGDPDALPFVDASGVLRLTHAQGWMIDHLIDVCSTADHPVVWAIDDWDELTHAHPGGPRIDRLERLLAGSARMRFVASAPRRGVGQRLAQAATTRIVFPPAADTDVVLFGLSATRFRGEWPAGRAVILGDAAQTDDRDGADIQVVRRAEVRDMRGAETRESRASGRAQADATQESAVRTHVLWTGFERRVGPGYERLVRSTRADADAIAMGLDPGGRAVDWSPERDGAILTVRCSPPLIDSPDLRALTDTLRAHGIAVLDERQDRSPGIRATDAAGPICVVAGAPDPRSAGFGVETAPGPTLLLGDWRDADLRAAGHRWLAPIPPAACASWWLMDDTTTPVRLHDASTRCDIDSSA